MGDPTLLRKALALERDGHFGEALCLFQQCADDPAFDAGDMMFHRGWCAENLGDTANAIAHYNRAAELTRIPECKLNSFFRTGWLFMHVREVSKAADCFRYAIDYGDLVDLRNDAYFHGMYWFAHALELSERFLEALKWYRRVQSLSPQLDPESRLRQIFCLVHVGNYQDALNICRTFDIPSPEGFDVLRYEALQAEARKEYRLLEVSLVPPASFRKAPPHVG
ncbi:MAG: tetratricopeptide repeat protein [Phycisphaeraceae bacterium]|nr:tetratricopeptide repeat protein [Bacteroidota bacterium]MCW5768130.1 tetratricopeptide repeat protein [Phycisphaeraceae bacterium]